MGFRDCVEMRVDYMDMNTGNIYKIQDYFVAKERGLPVIGIAVVDYQGNLLHYVTEKGKTVMKA